MVLTTNKLLSFSGYGRYTFFDITRSDALDGIFYCALVYLVFYLVLPSKDFLF